MAQATYTVTIDVPRPRLRQAEVDLWRRNILRVLVQSPVFEGVDIDATTQAGVAEQYQFLLEEIVSCSGDVEQALESGDVSDALDWLRQCAELARGLLEVDD